MDNLGSSRFEDLFCGTVYTSEGYQVHASGNRFGELKL